MSVSGERNADEPLGFLDTICGEGAPPLIIYYYYNHCFFSSTLVGITSYLALPQLVSLIISNAIDSTTITTIFLVPLLCKKKI